MQGNSGAPVARGSRREWRVVPRRSSSARAGFDDRSGEVRVTSGGATANHRPASLLGSYVLPGGVGDPRLVVEQARVAEASGLGTVWIGERYDTKDLPSLAGALTQTTSLGSHRRRGDPHPATPSDGACLDGPDPPGPFRRTVSAGIWPVSQLALARLRRADAHAGITRRCRSDPPSTLGRRNGRL